MESTLVAIRIEGQDNCLSAAATILQLSEEGMTISQHVSKIKEMARKLEDLGHKQDEAAIITKTLHSLPSNYCDILSAWDSVPGD